MIRLRIVRVGLSVAGPWRGSRARCQAVQERRARGGCLLGRARPPDIGRDRRPVPPRRWRARRHGRCLRQGPGGAEPTDGPPPNKCNTTNRCLGRGSRSQALTPRGDVTVSLRPRLARAGRYLGRHRWAGGAADEAAKCVTITTTITTTTKPEDRRQERGRDRVGGTLTGTI